MLRRIVVAAVALALGTAVSAGLLAYSGTVSGGRSVFAAARDLPAGAPLTADSVVEVHASLDPAQAAGMFGSADRRRLLSSRALHQLAAGQLIQRGDVGPIAAEGAGSLVLVPLKELPPVRAGDRVDLVALVGTGDKVVAQPFAWGVTVAALAPDGLVLQVRSRQELAFVYAAGTMRLAAVVTSAAAPPGEAAPISSTDAALEAAAG